MTTLWRISNYESLEGIGGLYSQGRWHPLGQRIVYLSEHPALALLEVMVHLEIDQEDLPDTFKLLKVEAPTPLDKMAGLELPDGWKENGHATQKVGLQWLSDGTSPVVRVPSAILPESVNVLLNPLHPDSKMLKITEVIPFPFDDRLTL